MSEQSVVGIYERMTSAEHAVQKLQEGGFPVDRISISYPVLWNGLKKIAADYHPTAQDALFAGTARRVYRL